MIKADYLYKGKELLPLLQVKLERLEELFIQKEAMLQEIKGRIVTRDTMAKVKLMINHQYEGDEEDGQKVSIEADISEIKFQIRKCKTLIIECKRAPRNVFVLDLEESTWLNF